MTDHQQNSARIARNTVYLYLRMIVVTLVSLYTSRIVLNTLGFDDFGIYNVVGSVVVFFSFFRNALRNATTRYISVELGKNDAKRAGEIFSMAVNMHIILGLLIALLLETVGVWVINTQLVIAPERLAAANWVFQFTIITFLASLIQIPLDSSIIAHERMGFYAVISLIEAGCKLGIALLLTLSPIDKLISYSGLLAMLALLVLAGYALYNRIALSDCRYTNYWDKQVIKNYVSYSGWSLLVNASDVGVTQGQAVLFNRFLGTIANSALGIAGQVYNAVSMFARNFASAFTPQIYKSYANGDRQYFTALLFSTSKLSYYLLLFPLIPLMLNLPFVLHIWLGAYPPLTPWYVAGMMLFEVFDSFQAPLWNAIFATGNIKHHQIMMAAIKLSVLPLTWLALHLGDNGVRAVLIWGLGNVCCAIVRIIYSHWFISLDLRAYWRKVILPMAATTLLTLPLPCLLIWHCGQGWTALLLSTPLSLVLLGASIYIVGLNPQEKDLVRSLPLARHFMGAGSRRREETGK